MTHDTRATRAATPRNMGDEMNEDDERSTSHANVPLTRRLEYESTRIHKNFFENTVKDDLNGKPFDNRSLADAERFARAISRRLAILSPARAILTGEIEREEGQLQVFGMTIEDFDNVNHE